MTKETHSSGGFLIALIALNSFTENFLINYKSDYTIQPFLLQYLYCNFHIKNSFKI